MSEQNGFALRGDPDWTFVGDPYKLSDAEVTRHIERFRLDVQVWTATRHLGLGGMDDWRNEAARPVRYAVLAAYARGAQEWTA